MQLGSTGGKISAHELRLALAVCLNGKLDRYFAMVAPVCSSFVTINAGTHMRCLSSPQGREEAPSVQLGNLLVARTHGPQKGFFISIMLSITSNVKPWLQDHLMLSTVSYLKSSDCCFL